MSFITVGIPSRNRLDSLRRCINSIAATIGCNFRICVLFGDDELGYKFLPAYPYVQKKNVSPRGYYVKDVNRTLDFMRETATAEYLLDYFVITQDDTEFVLPNWGNALISTLHRAFDNGYGAIDFFSQHGFSNVISRIAVFDNECDGKFLPEEYAHYFADSVRRQQLYDKNMFAWIDYKSPLECVCFHPHYATVDPTGLEARLRWFDQDEATFNARKKEYEAARTN